MRNITNLIGEILELNLILNYYINYAKLNSAKLIEYNENKHYFSKGIVFPFVVHTICIYVMNLIKMQIPSM